MIIELSYLFTDCKASNSMSCKGIDFLIKKYFFCFKMKIFFERELNKRRRKETLRI